MTTSTKDREFYKARARQRREARQAMEAAAKADAKLTPEQREAQTLALFDRITD